MCDSSHKLLYFTCWYCVVPFDLSPLSVPTAVGDNGEEVLYGTQNGRVGLVQVGPEEPLYRWDLDNDKREGGEGEGREGVRGKEGREGVRGRGVRIVRE